MNQVFVQHVSSCHRPCTDKQRKRSSGLCPASPTAKVGALEVDSFSDGFALLTAAPGGRWLHADALKTGVLGGRFITHGPRPCIHPSSAVNMRRFSGKCSDRRHASM